MIELYFKRVLVSSSFLYTNSWKYVPFEDISTTPVHARCLPWASSPISVISDILTNKSDGYAWW